MSDEAEIRKKGFKTILEIRKKWGFIDFIFCLCNDYYNLRNICGYLIASIILRERESFIIKTSWHFTYLYKLVKSKKKVTYTCFDFREVKTTTMERNRIPIIISKAKHWRDLLYISTADINRSLTKYLAIECIEELAMMEVSASQMSLNKFPSHSQSVERAIKLVEGSEAWRTDMKLAVGEVTPRR